MKEQMLLGKSKIRKFQKTGVLKIKNFFEKKEIHHLKKNLFKNLENKSVKFDYYYEKATRSKKILRRIEKISKNSKYFNKILCKKNLLKTLKLLNKNQNQFLFKDKLNFKYPNSEGFKPHIDGHFYWKNKKNKLEKGWRKYGDKFTNIVIPLEKVYKKNGCLYLSQKQYTNKMLGKNWDMITKKLYPKKRKIIFSENLNLIKKFNFKPYPLNIGDVLFFDWKVCHFSKKNISKQSRMIIYATYSNKKNIMNRYYLDKKNSKSTEKQKVFF